MKYDEYKIRTIVYNFIFFIIILILFSTSAIHHPFSQARSFQMSWRTSPIPSISFKATKKLRMKRVDLTRIKQKKGSSWVVSTNKHWEQMAQRNLAKKIPGFQQTEVAFVHHIEQKLRVHQNHWNSTNKHGITSCVAKSARIVSSRHPKMEVFMGKSSTFQWYVQQVMELIMLIAEG